MDIEDLFREPEGYQEEEKGFEMVLPELNPCSAENTDEIDQKKKQKGKECCGSKSLTCSQLAQEEEKKGEEQVMVNPKHKNKCFKCKTAQANYANKQDKVCKKCFLEYMVHKFKSSLRQNLKIWKDDLNLICISGGSSSMALLKMMHESLFVYSQKKMFFKVHIIYIDEGECVYGWNQQEHEDKIRFIIDACTEYNFTYTIIPIEQIYDIQGIDTRQLDEETIKKIQKEKVQDEEAHSTPLNLEKVTNQIVKIENIQEKRQRLMTLINSLPTISSFREDLIFYIKKWIISAFALTHNFKKILLGTNAHKVSTQLLSQLAKGRGLTIPHEVSFIDDKNFGGQISYMNPMRDFLQKEIGLFNYLTNVKIIPQKPLAQLNNSTTNSPAFASTDLLIDSFFSKLQDRFNVNTVPTVVRLTNKLLKGQVKGRYPFCPLCFGVRDEINNLLEMGSTIKEIVRKEEGEAEVISIKSSDEWLSAELQRAFCFGCKRLSTSAIQKQDFIDNLPEIIKENSIKTIKESQ